MKKNNLIAVTLFFIIAVIYTLPVFHNIHYWGQMDWDQFTFLECGSERNPLNVSSISPVESLREWGKCSISASRFSVFIPVLYFGIDFWTCHWFEIGDCRASHIWFYGHVFACERDEA